MTNRERLIAYCIKSTLDIFEDVVILDLGYCAEFEKAVGVDAEAGLLMLRALVHEMEAPTVTDMLERLASIIRKELRSIAAEQKYVVFPAANEGTKRDEPRIESRPLETPAPPASSTANRSPRRTTEQITAGVFTEERQSKKEYDLDRLMQRLKAGIFLAADERIALQFKLCTKCKTIKAFDLFARSGSAADGKQAWCKQCNIAPKKKKETPVEKAVEKSQEASKTEFTDEEPENIDGDVIEDSDETSDSSDEETEQEELDAEPLRTKNVMIPASLIYSKPVRCPKCGAGMIRLVRSATADKSKDFWLHLRTGQQRPCEIKIAHYQIKDDKDHKGTI